MNSTFNVPSLAYTNPFRLCGKGMKVFGQDRCGDLYVQISVPTKPNGEQRD